MNAPTSHAVLAAPRFAVTYCSQCGACFGPGKGGFSHCDQHGGGREPDLTKAEYVDALRRMDWSFEFSDDHRAYTAGRKALQRLHELRALCDPDGSIWAAHAPEATC